MELIADGLWDLIEVTLVLFREEDLLDPELTGSKDLFFESADGEDFAGEGDLSGHSSIASDFASGVGTGECGGHGDTGGWAVFRYGAFRKVDVGVECLIEVFGEPECFGAASDVGIGGLGRFFHDVTELSGQDEVTLAFDGDRFGVEDFTADGSPCETVHAADHIAVFFGHGHVFHGAKIFFYGLGGQCRQAVIGKNDFFTDFAAESADGAFQIADAGFSGIAPDDAAEKGRSEIDVFRFESVSFSLAGYEVFLCDLQLFFFGVAGELDEFHAV